MDVHITVPAYEEGREMRDTLDSIRDQHVPEYVGTLGREVWVTPSTGETMRVAEETPGFGAVEAPSGKLSTRNAAHDEAAARGFDVLVTWDADAPAKSDETLENLLEPFRDPNVAAVRGEPVSDWHLFGALENVGRHGARLVFRHLHGQLSAFTADAWQHAGPFAEDLDQTEIAEVWREEEVDFARRLRDHGPVVHARGAKVHNDSRRTFCRWQRSMAKFGRSVDPWCEERGQETFAPRDHDDCDCW